MKKLFLSLLGVVFLALSLYALFDIVSAVWLIARYETFDAQATAFISGKLLFTSLCLGLFFLIRKAAKKSR
ncbi:MAG TPA: hypothetical protein DEF05_04025 [Erwinia sp.]|uniref:hypothetical protein n=1 Tax=Erwinia citreus TaxID=558 RepID=UPI000E7E9A66|nr:hypothetical protein [Erwinia sp.]HBV38866.1 hypothetical protein [Erwinia sp.]